MKSEIRSIIYSLSLLSIASPMLGCVPIGGNAGSTTPSPTPPPSPTPTPPPIGWNTVGSMQTVTESEADYVSLAVNRQTGFMAVAYQDQGAGGKLSVQGIPFNGSTWQYLGTQGFTVGIVNYVSLAISPNGTTYVAFKDLPPSPAGGKANIYRYNNTTWDYYTDESGNPVYPTDGIANNVDLAVPQSDIPYIVYSLDYTAYLGVSFRDLGWQKNIFETYQTNFDRIAFVPNVNNSDMYIAVKDVTANNSITVFSSQPPYTTLNVVGSRGLTLNEVYYVALAVDSNGIPFVAFEDAGADNKLTVMYYNGAGGWVYLGNRGISAGQAIYVSMALDKNGNPYVAYQDQSTNGASKLTVQYYNGESWSIVGQQGISTGQANYISLKMNPLTNQPVVAYQDGGLGNQLVVLQYTAP